MLRTICVGAASLLLSANLSFAGSVGQAERKDFQVAKDIATTVQRYAQFTIFDDVNANVLDGVVTLTGKVTMPFKRDDIERRIARVDGVRGVKDQITVLPVSQFDDELRIRIARAIYGSPHFRGYGSMVNPPIHIIVAHGRVTLEGVVNNNVDRMIARSIASSFLSFDLKNDLKTTQEAKDELEKL